MGGFVDGSRGCGVLNRKGTHRSTEENKSDIHKHRDEVYNDQGTLHELGLEAGKEIDRRPNDDQYFDSRYNPAVMSGIPVGDWTMKAEL